MCPITLCRNVGSQGSHSGIIIERRGAEGHAARRQGQDPSVPSQWILRAFQHLMTMNKSTVVTTVQYTVVADVDTRRTLALKRLDFKKFASCV